MGLDNTLRKARTRFINEQLTLELDAFRKTNVVLIKT